MPHDSKLAIIKEGLHEYEAVTCDYCNETVDLSAADDVDDAIETWNAHVDAQHPDSAEDT
jgi:hypothetical protein